MGDLVAVSTPAEFQDALSPQNWTSHVLVRAHLNMVRSPRPPESSEDYTLDNGVVRISPFTKSIVGNCSDAGPAPAGFGLTEPLPAGACAILVKEDFMDTDLKASLWLHNLYVVVAATVGSDDSVLFLHTNGDVYITNTTLQGAGTNSRAIELSPENGASPALWLQDVVITGFSRPSAPGVLLGNDTTVSLENVVLKDLNLTSGGDVAAGSALMAMGGAGALLESTTITNNLILGEPAGVKAVALLGGDDGAVVYALPAMTVWDWSDEEEEPTQDVKDIGERGGSTSGGFLQTFLLRDIQVEQASLVAEVFGFGTDAPSEAPEIAPVATAGPAAAAPGDSVAPAAVTPTPATTSPVAQPRGFDQPPNASQPGGTVAPSPESQPGGVLDNTADTADAVGADGESVRDSSSQLGWIIGSAVGAALLVALCGVLVLIVLLRRQRRRQQEAHAKDSWQMNPPQALWPGSLPSTSSGDACAGAAQPAAATASAAVSLGAANRSHTVSRTGSASSNGTLSGPSPPAYIHPATSATSASMHAAGGLSGMSVNPTVGSMYPTSSAQSGRSAEGLHAGPRQASPTPDKLSRAAVPPPDAHYPVKPPLSGNSALRALPSGASSAAAGGGVGSVAMVSLAAQSLNPSGAGAGRGESVSSLGIALPTSTKDFSSCGVVHGSNTLGTTFDSIPVEEPSLPLPTTADREGGALMPPDLLEHALDNLSAAQVPFMGEFRLLGPLERRGGGQGLVQFATQMRGGDPVAIKFFMNNRAFECERDLYSQEHLRGMMPAVSLMHSNADGTVQTQEGWVFPPFIVVERGESLDEWQAHVKPDFATVVQVLSHICERVKTLHDAGVAHRDLKPGNVLWRPKHYSWTLIDFGCAAEIGAISRLTFSVSYSPPETLMVLRAGQRTIKSDPAADIWAIGLVAYELIHRRRAFREFSWTFSDVLDAAAGTRAYPWEDRPGSFARDPELRALGSVVRACLSRDSAARPTAGQLVQRLNQLFDSHGTTLVPGTHTSDAEPSVPMPEAAAMAQTASTDAASVGADAGSEAPMWDSRDEPARVGGGAVRPPPGITPSHRPHTYTHSRIELNSLQPSSILATTAEVGDNGAFDAGLRAALAHAWGASARLATTLEGDEGAEDAALTDGGAGGRVPTPPVSAAAALMTASTTVTTADTAGDTSSASAVGGGGSRGGGGGSGNPRSPAECAVSASGAESSFAAGISGPGTHDEG